MSADGRAEVLTHFGNRFPDPPGVVTFAKNASGRMVVMGELAVDKVTIHDDASYREVCSVRYSFFAERTDRVAS